MHFASCDSRNFFAVVKARDAKIRVYEVTRAGYCQMYASHDLVRRRIIEACQSACLPGGLAGWLTDKASKFLCFFPH